MPDKFMRFGVGRLLLAALVLAAVILLLLAGMSALRPVPHGPKPVLGLMTTLPLQWSEGGIEADLAKDAEPHPAFVRLSRQYDIQAIDDLEGLTPRSMPLFLLAQPRAFSPSELVRLDNWVRQGGRALILADPALQWGSLYPLGDKRRPLFTSMLSPLFTYWGVELVLPMTNEVPAAIRRVGKLTFRTQTPGEWLPKQNGGNIRCAITARGLLADCKIGKGRAILVADADILDTAFWKGQGMRMITGGDEFANMALVETLLAALKNDKGLNGDFVGK
jgi:hypothetical protein